MSDYYRINYLIFMKPRLPGLGCLAGCVFLKFTPMVHRKTAPTGPGVKTGPKKERTEWLWCVLFFLLHQFL